ncbi:MAG: hypothetical protein LUG18_13975 [Candidatus Azobacteroides sp.]|nr:hypothetical protein [Candidatus Azobacteroides sp.]
MQCEYTYSDYLENAAVLSGIFGKEERGEVCDNCGEVSEELWSCEEYQVCAMCLEAYQKQLKMQEGER